MSTIADPARIRPTRPPARVALADVDQARVDHLTAALQLGACGFYPPGDPVRPAAARLLWIARTGIRTRDAGECCVLDAVHHLLGDTGHVTVLWAAEVSA